MIRVQSTPHLNGKPVYKSQEEQYDEIQVLRYRVADLREDNQLLRGQLAKCRAELSRRYRETEARLEDAVAKSELPGAAAGLSGLKLRVFRLEQMLREKEEEVRRLRADTRTSRLHEMRIQVQLYYRELQRLRRRLTEWRPPGGRIASVDAASAAELRRLRRDNKKLRAQLGDPESLPEEMRVRYQSSSRTDLVLSVESLEARVSRGQADYQLVLKQVSRQQKLQEEQGRRREEQEALCQEQERLRLEAEKERDQYRAAVQRWKRETQSANQAIQKQNADLLLRVSQLQEELLSCRSGTTSGPPNITDTPPGQSVSPQDRSRGHRDSSSSGTGAVPELCNGPAHSRQGTSADSDESLVSHQCTSPDGLGGGSSTSVGQESRSSSAKCCAHSCQSGSGRRDGESASCEPESPAMSPDKSGSASSVTEGPTTDGSGVSKTEHRPVMERTRADSDKGVTTNGEKSPSSEGSLSQTETGSKTKLSVLPNAAGTGDDSNSGREISDTTLSARSTQHEPDSSGSIEANGKTPGGSHDPSESDSSSRMSSSTTNVTATEHSSVIGAGTESAGADADHQTRPVELCTAEAESPHADQKKPDAAAAESGPAPSHPEPERTSGGTSAEDVIKTWVELQLQREKQRERDRKRAGWLAEIRRDLAARVLQRGWREYKRRRELEIEDVVWSFRRRCAARRIAAGWQRYRCRKLLRQNLSTVRSCARAHLQRVALLRENTQIKQLTSEEVSGAMREAALNKRATSASGTASLGADGYDRNGGRSEDECLKRVQRAVRQVLVHAVLLGVDGDNDDVKIS